MDSPLVKPNRVRVNVPKIGAALVLALVLMACVPRVDVRHYSAPDTRTAQLGISEAKLSTYSGLGLRTEIRTSSLESYTPVGGVLIELTATNESEQTVFIPAYGVSDGQPTGLMLTSIFASGQARAVQAYFETDDAELVLSPDRRTLGYQLRPRQSAKFIVASTNMALGDEESISIQITWPEVEGELFASPSDGVSLSFEYSGHSRAPETFKSWKH